MLTRTPCAFALPQRPLLKLLIHTVVLLGTFLLLEAFVSRAGRLPPAAFQEPILALQLARRIGPLWIILLAVGAAVLLRFGALYGRWEDLELGKPLRGFVVFLCGTMAWPLATYGYNYFFDQPHGLDRFLIALLLLLTWWRPLFVYVFLLLAYALMGQLTEPALGGTILAHKLQVLRAISLFGASYLVFAISGYRSTQALLLLICCHVAAAYWLPALAKIDLGWLASTRLAHIPLAAHAHGWLSFLTVDQIVFFSALINAVDLPAQAAVLGIEAACLCLLFRRRLTFGLLVAVIVFHLFVFAIYGFLFWTWIALDGALLVLLMRVIGDYSSKLYSRGCFVLSIVLIGLGAYWSKPPALAWYDTPLTYTYHVNAITRAGEKLNLHPRFFAPYEDVFTMGSFGYLSTRPRLPLGPYGVTDDASIHAVLMAASETTDIFAIERRLGRSRHNMDRARAFTAFIERFVGNRNRRGDVLQRIYAVHPPSQFHSHSDGLTKLTDRRIGEVIVTEVTTFFDGAELVVMRELEVARINIPVQKISPAA